MKKKRLFWIALFQTEKVILKNCRANEASEKTLSDSDIQKATSCQISMICP